MSAERAPDVRRYHVRIDLRRGGEISGTVYAYDAKDAVFQMVVNLDPHSIMSRHVEPYTDDTQLNRLR